MRWVDSNKEILEAHLGLDNDSISALEVEFASNQHSRKTRLHEGKFENWLEDMRNSLSDHDASREEEQLLETCSLITTIIVESKAILDPMYDMIGDIRNDSRHISGYYAEQGKEKAHGLHKKVKSIVDNFDLVIMLRKDEKYFADVSEELLQARESSIEAHHGSPDKLSGILDSHVEIMAGHLSELVEMFGGLRALQGGLKEIRAKGVMQYNRLMKA